LFQSFTPPVFVEPLADAIHDTIGAGFVGEELVHRTGAAAHLGLPPWIIPELKLELGPSQPRGLPGVPVFTHRGKPITGSTIRIGLEIACRRAGITDFTFHDLRHSFTTNMRRAGVHDLVIMAITGHKTPAMFMRYNTVSREELMTAARKIGRDGHLYGHPTNFNSDENTSGIDNSL
jgi:hypothetical protein